MALHSEDNEHEFCPLNAQNILKMAEAAIVPPEKLTEYALNPESPRGCHKALLFHQVLGFTRENHQELAAQVLERIRRYPAISRGNKGFGEEFQVAMPVAGPNGTAVVITGWLLEENRLTLTTIRVGKAKEQRKYKYLLEEMS